jgi:hypothetical protein
VVAASSDPGALRFVPVGLIRERFLVPAYQRGYRWGPDQVTQLLDDIFAIRPDKDYCLQPIVVKQLPDKRLELIDGQQRLTTLYLLYLYMKRQGYKQPEPPFTIAYATRPQSAEFLADLHPERSDDNIDFHHLHAAYVCIEQWFARHDDPQLVADEIYMHLGRRAKFIVYEASPSDDPVALFTRLNVGRIPLTNAELVKALLLSSSREGTAQADDRRKLEIAKEWDLIERDLHDEPFWAFVTNRSGKDYPTRIELLFELLAGTPLVPDRFRTFFYFKNLLDEGRTPKKLWEDILARHALLKEWHDDRDLYHRIGYLIATTPDGQAELAGLLTESERTTKTQFEAGLADKISRRLGLTAEQLDELDYEHDRARCERVLLLFNVETTRKLKDSFERYPFHAHKAKRWSLEHIHAQNAEALTRKTQWQEWLREHAKALRGLRVPDSTAIEVLISEIEESFEDVTLEIFTALSARVGEAFGQFDSADSIHGIENLALLSGAANSALGNAVFEVKRRRILEMDRAGEYLPICTRRVFLKYYTESEDQQLQFWSKKDREAYLQAIVSVLETYLTRAEETTN